MIFFTIFKIYLVLIATICCILLRFIDSFDRFSFNIKSDKLKTCEHDYMRTEYRVRVHLMQMVYFKLSNKLNIFANIIILNNIKV